MNRKPSGRLARDRHCMGVAAEGGDIALHPFKRGNLVHISVIAQQAALALLRQRRKTKESEPPQPIVETDEDHSLARKLCSVKARKRASTDNPRASIDPHQHRQVLPAVLRNPDIRIQAIFRGRIGELRRKLHAVVAKGSCLADPAPFGRGLRRTPTQLAHRRRRERDTFERSHSACGGSLNPACLDGDYILRMARGNARHSQTDCQSQNNTTHYVSEIRVDAPLLPGASDHRYCASFTVGSLRVSTSPDSLPVLVP